MQHEATRLLGRLISEGKRVQELQNQGDALKKQLAGAERALNRALNYQPSSPSHSTSPRKNYPNLPEICERDCVPTTTELGAEIERDAALLELRQLKESMKHLELNLSDLDDRASSGDERDSPQVQVRLFLVPCLEKLMLLI